MNLHFLLRPVAVAGLAVLPLSSANGDIVVTAADGTTRAFGSAGQPGFDPQSYDMTDTLASFGDSVDVAGQAISGTTRAASTAAITTSLVPGGFRADLDATSFALRGASGAGALGNGESDILLTFTLTEAGPLHIDGSGAVSGPLLSPYGNVELILRGPGGTTLYLYNPVSFGPTIHFSSAMAQAGTYQLTAEARSQMQDAGGGAGTGSGSAFAHFAVTVPSPGSAALLILTASARARRRRG